MSIIAVVAVVVMLFDEQKHLLAEDDAILELRDQVDFLLERLSDDLIDPLSNDRIEILPLLHEAHPDLFSPSLTTSLSLSLPKPHKKINENEKTREGGTLVYILLLLLLLLLYFLLGYDLIL